MTNPILEHLPVEGDESFFVKEFDLPYFDTPWHYHPEFELVLVVRGRGKRFIGNTISEFGDGDLSFFGPNLPHLYRNPPEYYEEGSSPRVRSIVVHFLERSIGRDLLALPQSKNILKLLERCRQGIDIGGETKEVVIGKMHQLPDKRGMGRLLGLLDILHILSETSEYRFITDYRVEGNNPSDADRLEKVFGFVARNFHKEILLDEVARLTHMTRTSFCRFFLERTKRTFSNYLIEVRLNHASRLLIEQNISIMEVAYCCGYNNLSNFNRQFKEKFALSPRAYRQTYLSNLGATARAV
ncbi:MAG TPA: AraC family transcriptional regulator [Puia sp.]|nr:AraC family transcriptional regulator [Puia sp.]